MKIYILVEKGDSHNVIGAYSSLAKAMEEKAKSPWREDVTMIEGIELDALAEHTTRESKLR